MKKTLLLSFENYFLALFFLGSIALIPAVAFAEEQSQFTEMARERQYPGGRDESDLKVQQKTSANTKTKPVDRQESDEGF